MGKAHPTKDTFVNPYISSTTATFNDYEFGGPIGALAITIILPIVTLALVHFASVGGIDLKFFSSPFSSSSNRQVMKENSSAGTITVILYCMVGCLAWFLLQVLLERILPCEMVQGALLPLPRHQNISNSKKDDDSVKEKNTTKRLTYRINGHLAFWVTLLLAEVGWPTWDVDHQRLNFGRAPLHILYDYYGEIAFATILWCFILSIYIYVKSFADKESLLAQGGISGNVIYDFFIGRELNPRSLGGSFDWKEFCELRPGLIGWALLNIAFMSVQQEKLGYVTSSMLFVNVFQFIYVWDALFQERAILTTMDITTDGFGFMLIFGDLAWVPFTYSIQARFLVDYDPGLNVCSILAILVTNSVGYWIFRGANSQKDLFRRDPSCDEISHLKYLQTKRGTRLITSGWWGMARKINYTGDWIMGLSWCLACGFQSIVPYYYAIYFCILLVHRSIRDDHMCQEKYGDDWNRYKNLVPYRFIPGVV